jgi:FeS assembly ATPase SufC
MLLRDIHLAIPKGHLVVLLGGSGAGKTTFLNAVNGYEKAKAEIMLNGHNVYTQYKDMLYEVGVVPQSEIMRNKDTVIGTMRDVAKLRLSIDIPLHERLKRVDYVLEIFGLTPVKEYKVEKLSGGQKKRLSIAMELVSNPSVFMLDETDSGLDVDAVQIVSEGVAKFHNEENSCLIITHNTRILEHLKVDKVHVLMNGQIVEEGGPELIEDINRRGFTHILAEQEG